MSFQFDKAGQQGELPLNYQGPADGHQLLRSTVGAWVPAHGAYTLPCFEVPAQTLERWVISYRFTALQSHVTLKFSCVILVLVSETPRLVQA